MRKFPVGPAKRLLLAGAAAALIGGFAAPLKSAPVALGVTGRTNANVSIAARGQFVAAVWSASVPNGATDVFAAVSRDGGARFSAPVRVNHTAGQVNVNGEQPPRVALVARSSGDPAIAVVWTAKGSKGTQLLQARSADGGRTFSPSAMVPGSDAAGNRGWEGATVDASGRVVVAWLDHRALASQGESMATTHHHTSQDPPAAAPKLDGVAMAQQSKLYYATLDDPASPRAITGGVCYCCKVATAAAADGRVAIAWRHVYPGNLRDIAFTISRDAGKTFSAPVRASEDKWQIEGCPDDGPAMAFDAVGQVHLVWPTLVTDGRGSAPSIGIFYASSKDGRGFGARMRLTSEGVPHHPQLTIGAGGQLMAVWDELGGGSRRIAIARGTAGADGKMSFVRQVISTTETGLYPMAASTSDGFVVAWTSGLAPTSVIRVDRR